MIVLIFGFVGQITKTTNRISTALLGDKYKNSLIIALSKIRLPIQNNAILLKKSSYFIIPNEIALIVDKEFSKKNEPKTYQNNPALVAARKCWGKSQIKNQILSFLNSNRSSLSQPTSNLFSSKDRYPNVVITSDQ